MAKRQKPRKQKTKEVEKEKLKVINLGNRCIFTPIQLIYCCCGIKLVECEYRKTGKCITKK
jgi:hypothetical protein